MSTDVGRIDYAAGYCHMGWVAIIQVGFILTILLVNIGPSALAGFGLVIVAGPLLSKAVRKLHQKRRKSTKFTDTRVRLIQEMLSCMRVIKFYAWERSFLGRIMDTRRAELKIVRFLLLLKTAVNAVSMSIPVYAAILAFVTYSVTGHSLHPANIFSSLTLFNLLRMPLLFLPMVISACIDAWVALGRIQNLLLGDEIEKPMMDHDSEFAVSVQKGIFVWEVEEIAEPPTAKTKGKWSQDKKKKSGYQTNEMAVQYKAKSPQRKPIASTARPIDTTMTEVAGIDDIVSIRTARNIPRVSNNISFKINRGEFIVVVGEIGSGKSSLLSALVGEMRRERGFVELGGAVAFCPQVPWIQNATLKNNILFGKEMDRTRYDRVIRECALDPDLAMLPNGDETEIGERGVTLSGGQKARVNIARAAYSDADIFLLDDPLSAVDAHVGLHLLERCIRGSMAGKTRILVTHQLPVLPYADRIFCMEQGKIVTQGTYQELLSQNTNFTRLIEKFVSQPDKKTETEGEEGSKENQKEKKLKGKPKGLMALEERATGSVAWSVYSGYARAGGGLWIIFAVIGTVMLANGVNLSAALWLTAWISDRYHLSERTYVAVYAVLGFSQAIFIFIFGFILTMVGNRATEKFHEKVRPS